jgi:hypothetical protein
MVPSVATMGSQISDGQIDVILSSFLSFGVQGAKNLVFNHTWSHVRRGSDVAAELVVCDPIYKATLTSNESAGSVFVLRNLRFLPHSIYLQKSLKRVGDSAVYFTVCWMFTWPR